MASPPSQSGSAADDDVCWRETAYYYGGARLLRYLARRASDKKRGRDGTKYSKFHPRGYLSHHLAAITAWRRSTRTPRTIIADGVIGLKQRSLAANDPTE